MDTFSPTKRTILFGRVYALMKSIPMMLRHDREHNKTTPTVTVEHVLKTRGAWQTETEPVIRGALSVKNLGYEVGLERLHAMYKKCIYIYVDENKDDDDVLPFPRHGTLETLQAIVFCHLTILDLYWDRTIAIEYSALARSYVIATIGAVDLKSPHLYAAFLDLQ